MVQQRQIETQRADAAEQQARVLAEKLRSPGIDPDQLIYIEIMTITITVPNKTLLVLCGPAGSGKSTFATRRFISTSIVSSDYCRAMICDDENNQQVNRDTFDLFYYIIQKRMYLGRFTVADSTALRADARRRLRAQSRYSGYYGCLLIFNTPLDVCLARDKLRPRRVGEQVILYHNGLLQQTLLDAPNEGWEQVHVLDVDDMDAQVEIFI